MSSADIAAYTATTAEVDQAIADLARVRPVLEKIADKWTILILTVLCEHPSRFNQIKRRLDGITHKALSDALKRLESYGLVTRTVLPTRPVGVEYTITPLALSLRGPFAQLWDWALEHGDALLEASATKSSEQA
jgi:DNA-binding HxlR family transcriptional regulator